MELFVCVEMVDGGPARPGRYKVVTFFMKKMDWRMEIVIYLELDIDDFKRGLRPTCS